MVKGLTQNKQQLSSTVFYWNIKQNYIDPKVFDNLDYVIHLAGSGIADKRWTDARKKEIVDSRVESTLFLAESLRQSQVKIKALVGASAIGYYGTVTTDKIFSENDLPATDFLGDCCRQWENAYNEFNEVADRTVILRLSTVIAKDGGALQKIIPLVKAGISSPLGSGSQYMPLIHIDDLCRMFEFALQSNCNGAYNAACPQHINNRQLMKSLAQALHKPFFLPAVPAFMMHLVYGELAALLLQGSRVSADKITGEGFTFTYPNLKKICKELFS